MNCPFCDHEAAPRSLHAHLGEAHGEHVVFEERIGRVFYGITCPVCGEGYRQEIKPRSRDAGFVDEFAGQIRLVAFDMLINHLLVEHEPETAGPAPADEAVPPPVSPPAPGAGPAWLTEARRQAAGSPPERS